MNAAHPLTVAAVLTVEALIAKGACEGQRDLFRQLFGDFVIITPELCVEHAAKFDWNWAAEHLLTPSAQAEYDRACDAAYAEYERVHAQAYAEYDRVHAQAYAEYDRVHAQAQAEFGRVCDTAWAEFGRLCAETFGRLYCAQEAQP